MSARGWSWRGRRYYDGAPRRHRVRAPFRPSVFILFPALLTFFAALQAFASEVTRRGDWVVEHWTPADGLPLAHLTGVAQTPDGLLWLSTFDGLVRFDGVRFLTLRPADLDGLPSSRLTSMVEDDGGALWISTAQGAVVRVEGGVARSWSPAELGGEALFMLRQGTQIWVLCETRVLRVEGGVPVRFGDPDAWGPEVGALADLALAPDGGAWVIGQRALIRLDADGAMRGRYDSPGRSDAEALMAVALTPSGDALVVAEGALMRPSGGALIPLPTHGAAWSSVLCGAIIEDEGFTTVIGQRASWRLAPDGALIPLAESSMEACLDVQARRDQRRWRVENAALSLDGELVLRTASPIRTVLPTPEGVWVITNGDGLYFLRPALVHMEGVAGSAEGMLVGPSGERITLQHGGLVLLGDPPALFEVRQEETSLQRGTHLDALAADAQGRIWAGGLAGLCVLEGEACDVVRFPGQNPVRPLVLDGAGSLWVDTGRGLGRTPPGQGPDAGWELVEAHEPWMQAGTATRLPDGSVAVAFRNHGLRLYRGGGEVLEWTGADGRGLDQIRGLYADPTGLLWIATTDGGLCELDLAATPGARPTPRCLTRALGLPTDTIHAVTLDEEGRLWMSSNQGIFFVLRSDAEAALDQGARLLSPLMLAERDGMANREANGLSSPNVGLAADGTLYFPTQSGVARVEPARIPLPAPPHVRVEQVRVNGVEVASSQDLQLKPGERDVAFAWTAPEFRWPDQLRFRSRLVGYSETWSALSDARTASWTNLPPGEYTFEVEAVLGGSWSETPARVRFSRAPALVETAGFRAGVALGALGLVVGLFLWRGRLRQLRILALEEVVQRRTEVLSEQNAALAERNRTVAEQAERLARLDRLKTTFVSDLSHELRTPLTLVLGPLDDLLARPDALDERVFAAIRIAHRNAERLRELVGQLFDVARLEAGGMPLRARPLDLGALVRRVAERFLRAASEGEVALEIHADEGVVVWADADLIDKILSNLLGNALRFTPAGGRVTLRVSCAESASVSVTDTGDGIPPGELVHLFERFYRVEGAGGRAHDGAGIGLSLARDLVELHGGTMHAGSAPGKGSTFSFTLPLGVHHLRPEEVDLSASMSSPPQAPPASQDEDEDAAGPRASVLVVEDHADMRAYIAQHFAERFEVRTAPDGRAALAAIRQQRPDLVVSDVMMPELDGISMCREIRADPALRELPAILISAKGAEVDRLAGLEVASAWFSKPFRMRELLDMASRLAPRPPAPVAVEALSESDQRFLERLHARVQAALADPELSVVKLSRAMAMSRRQLLREVSRLTGQPVVAFIQRQRMEAARELLRQDRSRPVSEVASAVGMNRAYFSRLYSAWYGHPPSEERQTPESG